MENLNLSDIVTFFTVLVTIMSILANFTKTDADNRIVAFLSKIVNLLAVNIRIK